MNPEESKAERESRERLHNYLLYKLYATDAELEDAGPLVLCIVGAVLAIMVGVYVIFPN